MKASTQSRKALPAHRCRRHNRILPKGGVPILSELFSGQQLKKTLRWILYALLFLISVLVQSVVLPRIPIGGVALCVVPTCVACVAVCEGAESATLYAIFCGLFHCFAGADLGPIYIVLLPVCAALSGAVCDNYYTRGVLPAMILSLMSLTLCGLVTFFFRVYLGSVSGALWATVLLPEILYSVLAFPLIYLGAWAVSRIGR